MYVCRLVWELLNLWTGGNNTSRLYLFCRLVCELLNLWTGGNNTSRLYLFAGSFESFRICGLGVIIRAVYISLPARLGGFEFVDWG